MPVDLSVCENRYYYKDHGYEYMFHVGDLHMWVKGASVEFRGSWVTCIII